MAEIIESANNDTMTTNSGNGKVNAALTLGIIGTALSAINSGGGILSLFGNGTTGLGSKSTNANLTNEELYIERSQFQNYLDITKQYYEGKIDGNERLTNAFFDAYKRDIDNSFSLYKNQRDSDDALSKRIDEVDKKVDIMSAIRPYQDALINAKIDNNALLAQYNLDKKTCKMITGQLVLPSTPTVTGFGSYYPWSSSNTTTNTTT